MGLPIALRRSWLRGRDRRAGQRLIHPGLLFGVLFGVLGVMFIANVGSGAVEISPRQVIAILLGRVGIDDAGASYSQQQDAVLWAIRLPRVCLAALVGAGLAVSGTILQGIFRNPLVEPGLIGVSSGASLGAVFAVVLGFNAFGTASLPAVAFVAALVTTLAVYVLARHNGKTEVVTLLLTGLALNSVAGAGTSFLTSIASTDQLRSIVFWSLGSLGGATWSSVLVVLPLIGGGVLLAPRWAESLNLLVLGEAEARHLGVETERVRLALILLTALMTGAAVAVAGAIGFVGLIVPHLIRLAVGPDHRVLLPASALAGACLLLAADLAARTLLSPVELPLGVVTALAGGPFFLWLLRRTRRAQGGWG